MNIVEGQFFEDEEIFIDYTIWRNNSFKDCTFILSIGEFVFMKNEVINCKISVRGRARGITQFIDWVYPHKRLFYEGPARSGDEVDEPPES